MNRITKLLLYLVGCILAASIALSIAGCGGTAGAFGLASVQDLNEQASALQKHAEETAEAQALAKQQETEAAIVASFAALEPFVPGVQQAVQDLFEGKPTVVVQKPAPVPPVPDNSAIGEGLVEKYGGPAGQLALLVAAAYAAYRKAKVDTKAEVNAERDEKRVARGEALTTEEAKAKGYFDDGAKA